MSETWPWAILRFCCEEVTRQRDGALNVPDLMRAWEDGIAVATYPSEKTVYEKVTTAILERWGVLAKPHLNAGGFRRHNVQVGEYIAPRWEDVPRLVDVLCSSIREGKYTPAEAYYEYEMIHPFADGNGRTGKILYNFLSASLLDPQMPPNFWHNDNP